VEEMKKEERRESKRRVRS